jgi:serine/threonine-protein kinase
VLAAVISREPDLSRLPADTPHWLRDLIERCLRRDVAMRLPHMGAARIAIIEADHEVGDEVEAAAAAASGLGWMAVAATLAAGLAVGALATRYLGGYDAAPMPTGAIHSEIVFDPPPLPDAYPTLSPDGRTLVYVGGDDNDPRLIYVRSLEDGTTRAIPGTEFAARPTFSPDGESLGFTAAGRVKTVRIGGGQPFEVATVSGGAEGMVWMDDDTLIYAALGTPHLQMVAATGGLPEALEINGLTDELWISDPIRVPGTNTLLVSISESRASTPRVAALDLDDRTLTEIVPGSSPQLVGPSTLVFLQRGVMVAAPFDAATMSLTGPERTVEPPGGVLVTTLRTAGADLVAGISEAGDALFPLEEPALRELMWVDVEGNETPTGLQFEVGAEQVIGANGAIGVSLSPDETRVAWIAESPAVVALDDVTQRRLLPRPGTSVAYPRWLPDGEDLFMIGNQTGDFRSYLVNAAGGEQPRAFTHSPQSIATSFFPDGQAAIGYVITAERARDLWYFPLEGDARPLLETAANERGPQISPSGDAFIYVSDESGVDRVLLRLYPELDRQAWPLSGDNGSAPMWSRDGTTVFYLENNTMMAVAVDLRDGVQIGTPRALFAAGAYEEDQFGNAMYDVASDGRFLMGRLGMGSRNWRWVRSWDTELNRDTP